MDVETITREEFERQFDVIPPAHVNSVIVDNLYGFGTQVKFVFVGRKHDEIQKLEKLYKLGDH